MLYAVQQLSCPLAVSLGICFIVQLLSLAGHVSWDSSEELASGADDMCSSGLADLAASCQHLTMLDLSGCTWPTTSSYMAVARSCSSLQKLLVSGGTRFTDDVANQLASTGKELASLHLYDCDNITDAGVMAIMQASVETGA